MSTIKSTASDRTLEVEVADGRVYLAIRHATSAPPSTIGVTPADLLAAIEAEGIGVVVKGTLPEVTVEGARIKAGQISWPIASARDCRDVIAEDALISHALVRWLDANPPTPEVDEADVDALAVVLVDVDPSKKLDTLDLARHLLASGRVTVTR